MYLDKKWQLADWRIRPIPEEMLEYARYDTHYLINLQRLLSSKLINQGISQKSIDKFYYLNRAFDLSKEITLILYKKSEACDYDFYKILAKCKESYGIEKGKICRILMKYRDYIARIKDKSKEFIIGKYEILKMMKNFSLTNLEKEKWCYEFIKEIKEEIELKLAKCKKL